ncbi:hypothetical protein [Terriglobus tenax]|uniref:hypothetical protein n=1 Tax=Terriglobus tenax TaxID=1111115 RepID=UPI0021E01325|nr:hypothetical protein [Terriglobus tenax]
MGVSLTQKMTAGWVQRHYGDYKDDCEYTSATASPETAKTCYNPKRERKFKSELVEQQITGTALLKTNVRRIKISGKRSEQKI